MEEEYILKPILEECKKNCTPDVRIDTLRRWWYTHEEWGELPYVAQKSKAVLQKKMAGCKKKNTSDTELLLLKELLDENPNIYLDELTIAFGVRTGNYVHCSTIWRYVTRELNYSLKVLTHIVREWCVQDKIQFFHTLDILLNECPKRLITIDDTHKDRNTTRKTRGWAKRNCEALSTCEWFQSVACYTLITAADINGFIPVACHTILRDHISNEVAAGTLDVEYFLYWIKTYLCPVLGNFLHGELQSIVLMDNASTHMSEEVEAAIRKTVANLIYGPLHSPHINPIKNYFNLYKTYIVFT